MAQKVTTTLIDDIDGSVIEVNTGRSITFAFDGSDYEIDLSEANSGKFRDAISDYIAASRRVSRGATRTSRTQRNNTEHLAAIRTWAAAHGHTVSQRGRIAQSIKDEFYAAQK
ncbi:Lsr2 protein [Curtobacterium sp. PhB130]|uniref:histone-like nucleoid-structuring protein Lsr2 n=1 Tax=Curtobacterium sp. PhB130 TaxID=2485178 RepID=UPI000F4B5E2F|nr:Lsr2 family protein [Curtobacterium sp. PhB130]ROS75873.1 Lsr2 protein [Curtobacterium sp. PhB130]